jgi:hypothetical protein
MARTKKTPFPTWATKKPNGIENRYIRLGDTFMLDLTVKNLSHAAFRVYTHMVLESGGKVEFIFPCSKWNMFISRGGFQSAKRELIDAGLIEVVEENWNTRKPNIYRFSAAWKDRPPP